MSCAALFPIDRGEYEQYIARERGQTIKTLGEIGMVSFPCTDCGDIGCLGWGHVQVPPNGDGESTILEIESRGVARDAIQEFGGRPRATAYGEPSHP